MARESVVSREFRGTKVTFLGLNTTTCEPVRMEHIFESRFNSDEDIMKQLTKSFKNTNIVPAKVIQTEDYVKLLAMRTEDFMSQAFELDLETRKRITPANNSTNTSTDTDTDTDTDNK